MTSKINKKVFNLIIIFFAIEYLRVFDLISIFQLFIIPLCLFGVLITKNKVIHKNFIFLIFLSVVLLFTCISSPIENFFTSFFFVIGVFILLLYLLMYFSENTIDKTTLIIFSFYSLPHVLILFADFLGSNLLLTFTGSASERFSGLHRDPNFMCVYVNLAIVSKLALININVKTKQKLLIIGLIILDIAVILYSMSISGIMIMFFSFIIYYWLNNKKILVTISFLSIPIIIWIYNIYNDLVYSSSLNLFLSVLWRQKQKSISGNLEDSRIDAFKHVFSLINEGEMIIYGYSMENYLNKYFYYPHNTFLDIIVVNGLLIGIPTILFIFYLFYKSYKLMTNKIISRWLFQISVSSFMSLIFLSMYQQKLFWLMIVLLFFSANRSLYLQQKEN